MKDYITCNLVHCNINNAMHNMNLGFETGRSQRGIMAQMPQAVS
jgi:hypothetical protein